MIYESEAAIQACLTCKRKTCDGECEKVKAANGLSRKPRKGEKLYQVGDEVYSLRGWSARTGITYHNLYQRVYRYGMTIEQAIARG